MAELFDKDGNLVEGAMTQEEIDAKVAEEKAAWEAEQKPDEQKPDEQKPDEQKPDEEMPEWAKNLVETMNGIKGQVDTVTGNQTKTHLSKFEAAIDDDKKEDFTAKYDSLTGYGDTPEEIERRAADAFLLTTGQRYEESGVDMRGFTGVGRGPVDVKKADSAAVKGIDDVFGISAEDAEKYGNKE